MRIIVAITGASGVQLGARLIKELKKNGAEVHIIISDGAKEVIKHECPGCLEEIRKFSDRIYDEKDFSAPVASGSFKTDGMAVIPCSMKTLSAIANGYAENLVVRAADVCIKQKRNLILVPRETPISAIHIENMLKLSRLGIWIIPPVLTFYHKPKNIEDIVDFIVGKVLEALGIEHDLYKKWGEK